MSLAAVRAPGGWHAGAPQPSTPRPPLTSDADADVVIVGAGFSGLWTAFHLLAAEPSLRVCILEREVIGFGASGRNGGWLMSAPPGDPSLWSKRFGLPAMRRAQGVLRDAVREIGEVLGDEQIDADLRIAGSLSIARHQAELARLRAHEKQLVEFGMVPSDVAWWKPSEVTERTGAAGVLGGLYVAPCGTLDPVKLIRGLAAAVERRGAVIHERSAAAQIEPGSVRTDQATVRAPRIVLATEAFTVELPGERRRYLPLTSTIIQTAPLSEHVLGQLGWGDGLAVGDKHHLFFYSQLTPGGRLTIGGRGAPYRLGAAVEHAGQADAETIARLEQTMHEVWPQTVGAEVEHRWSGSIAVSRDWCASCGLDSNTGIAWLGGYAGHGVAASYVLARSLAPLLRGQADPLGQLPWTERRSRRWEPEPLRWLAAQAIVRALGAADRQEAEGKSGRSAALAKPFMPAG